VVLTHDLGEGLRAPLAVKGDVRHWMRLREYGRP
jgi:hypothetical protein